MADESPNAQTEQAEQTAQLAAESHVVALANATSQHHLAREFAIAAMGRGEMTELQAADYMLAFSRQVVAAKDAAGGKPVEPAVTGGPRLSSNPAEAAAGMTAPEARDAGAVAARLEYLGADPKTWSSDDRAFLHEVAQATPPELLDDTVNLIRDAGEMEAAAREHRYAERTAEAELRSRWGARYDERIEWATIVFDQLPARAQSYLRARGLNTWPPFVDKLATLGEKFLNTDDGMRWTLAQAKKDAEAEARERAEEAARERQLDARFRDIR
jgi:hypothetical protein